MREYEKEFSDPFARCCAPPQQESKIPERVAAYNAGDMDEVARIDEREEERKKRRRIIEMSANVVQVYPRHRNQRAIIPLNVYVVLVHKQDKPCDSVKVLRICDMFIHSSFTIVE